MKGKIQITKPDGTPFDTSVIPSNRKLKQEWEEAHLGPEWEAYERLPNIIKYRLLPLIGRHQPTTALGRMALIAIAVEDTIRQYIPQVNESDPWIIESTVIQFLTRPWRLWVWVKADIYRRLRAKKRQPDWGITEVPLKDDEYTTFDTIALSGEENVSAVEEVAELNQLWGDYEVPLEDAIDMEFPGAAASPEDKREYYKVKRRVSRLREKHVQN